jgi:hypothetical protein
LKYAAPVVIPPVLCLEIGEVFEPALHSSQH